MDDSPVSVMVDGEGSEAGQGGRVHVGVGSLADSPACFPARVGYQGAASLEAIYDE